MSERSVNWLVLLVLLALIAAVVVPELVAMTGGCGCRGMVLKIGRGW